MVDIYSDNVIASKHAIRNCLKGEYAVSPEHETIIVHSKALDCNPHSKVKFKNSEPMSKRFNDKLVVFVPTTATTPVISDLSILSNVKELIIDIRSMEGKDSVLFTIFGDLVGSFACNAESPNGTKGKVYMSPNEPYISGNAIEPEVRRMIKPKITILLDRYTFKHGDEYSAMLLAYFYKHYTVKGKPHHMYKYIYKSVRFPDGDKKISFSLPVLKLEY